MIANSDVEDDSNLREQQPWNRRLGTLASGGPAYMITPEQMVHGTAVLEAIVASAESGARVKVG